MTRAINHSTGATSHLGTDERNWEKVFRNPYGRSFAKEPKLPRTYTRDASLSDPKLAYLDEIPDPLFDGEGDLYRDLHPPSFWRDGESTRVVPSYRVDRSKITLPKV